MKRLFLAIAVLLVVVPCFGASIHIEADFQDGTAEPGLKLRVGDTRDIVVHCLQNGTNWALGSGYTAKLKWFIDLDDTNAYVMSGTVSSNLVTFSPAANFWAFPVKNRMYGVELSKTGERVQPAVGGLTIEKSTFDITNEYTLLDYVWSVPQPTNDWSDGDVLFTSDGGTTTYAATVSGITDLGATNVSGINGLYLAYTAGTRTVYGEVKGGAISGLDGASITSDVPASVVPAGAVTQHEGSITIGHEQVSDWTSSVQSAETDTIATNLLAASYQTSVDATSQYVNVAGDTMTGDLIFSSNGISGLSRMQSYGSTASDYGLAWGDDNTVTARNSGAIGSENVVHGRDSFAGGSANTTWLQGSHAFGEDCISYGPYTFAAGDGARAAGWAAVAIGRELYATNTYATALGVHSYATSIAAFVWNSSTNLPPTYYYDHGKQTFNINPAGGVSGFWIGDSALGVIISNSYGALGTHITGDNITDGTISNADLAVSSVKSNNIFWGGITQPHTFVSDWTASVRNAENDTTATNLLVASYQTSTDATNQYVDEAGDWMSGDLWIVPTNEVGNEVISNGTFTGSANWWTIDTATYQLNKLVINDALSPTLTPTGDMNIVEGKTYTLSYNVAQTNMDVQVSVGGRTNKQYAQLGDFTWTFSAIEDTDPVFNLTTTNGQAYFDSVTLKENTNGNLSVGNNGYFGGDLRIGGTVYGTTPNASFSNQFVNESGDTMTGALVSDYLVSTNVMATNVFRGSMAAGSLDSASDGVVSFAFGNNVASTGAYSMATGNDTIAGGSASHAEGDGSDAFGYTAHAEGHNTKAHGYASHSGGSYSRATQDYTFVWSDGAVFGSTDTNQFSVYARGGIRLLGAPIEGDLSGGTNLAYTSFSATNAPTADNQIPAYNTNDSTWGFVEGGTGGSATDAVTQITVTDGTTSSNYEETVTLALRGGPVGTATGTIYNVDFSMFATGTPLYVETGTGLVSIATSLSNTGAVSGTLSLIGGSNVDVTQTDNVFNVAVDLSAYATGTPLYVYGETNSVEGGTGATVTQTGGIFNVAVDLGTSITGDEINDGTISNADLAARSVVSNTLAHSVWAAIGSGGTGGGVNAPDTYYPPVTWGYVSDNSTNEMHVTTVPVSDEISVTTATSVVPAVVFWQTYNDFSSDRYRDARVTVPLGGSNYTSIIWPVRANQADGQMEVTWYSGTAASTVTQAVSAADTWYYLTNTLSGIADGQPLHFQLLGEGQTTNTAKLYQLGIGEAYFD